MRILPINSINKCNSNNNNTNFKGTVSPEFVRYVNEIRKSCLQTVPKQNSNFINNVCNGILEKSNEIMNKFFPLTSVLSVDTTTDPESDMLCVEDGILKKYGCNAVNSESSKNCISPLKKLKWLKDILKNDNFNYFLDVYATQLVDIERQSYNLLKVNNLNEYSEGFSDMDYLLNWWDGHNDFPFGSPEISRYRKNWLKRIKSNLIKNNQKWKENHPKIISRKMQLEMKSVTEHIREHIWETVSMPDERLYGGRKNKEEMDKFLKDLLPKTITENDNIQISESDKLALKHSNIYMIKGTNHCYRGPLCYQDTGILKPLKLKVIHIDRFVNGDFVDNIDEIVDFIKAMQSGYVYFGCNFGMARTDKAVGLDYYLNPLQNHRREGSFTGADYLDLLDLCDKLTPAQKKEMRWTEEFEKELRQKIKDDLDSWDNNI